MSEHARERSPIEVSLSLDEALIGSIAERVASLLSSERPTEESAWPEWMNVETLARYLDCSPERIRKLVARREIPFAQEAAGCRISFRRQSIDAWLRDLEIPRRSARIHGPAAA